MPGQIFKRIFPSSIWIALMSKSRGIFPNNLSEIVSNLTYGRSAPDEAEPDWTSMVIEDGAEGGSCLPPAAQIDFGSKPRQFQLFRRALNGPEFCAENFRSTFDLELQLNAITKTIKDRVKIEWELHNRAEYSRMTDTKVVVNDCTSPAMNEEASGVATYPAVEATQIMGMGMLEDFGLNLIRDGATESAMLTQSGIPIFTVIGSPEFNGNMIRNNSEMRQDIRWAESGQGNGASLLKAFGVNHTFGNFAFLGDLFPRRFNFTGGVHVQVPTYKRYALTNGFTYKVNPLWKTATEEEVLIYDTMVMKQLIPQPIVAPAADFRFNPVSYIGEIGIRNIPNKVCNPDSNILFHRAILAASSMPESPERGISFLVKRCGPPCSNSTECASEAS